MNELSQQQLTRLATLGGELARRLERQVTAKRPIEERWLEDTRQYHGRYSQKIEDVLKSQQNNVGTTNIFVNLTRPKTDAGVARVADILFPSDDRNWIIKATPVQDLQRSAEQSANFDENEQKAKNMQKEIDDQLKEERYTIKARDAIRDTGILGTGIIKGPVTVGRSRKKWNVIDRGVAELEMIKDHRPGVSYVSPWDFFPEITAARIEDAEYVFERSRVNKKQIRRLAKHPGYFKQQLRKVLEDDGERSKHGLGTGRDITQRLREIAGIYTHDDDNRFEKWRYTGPVDKELVEALDIPTEEHDILDEVEAVVEFIGDIVIKLELVELETEELCYSVFNWIENEGSIFGYGIPYAIRAPQEAVNKAWRAMLDNAALSVGPQVVVDDSLIEPADGVWALTARKVWKKVEDASLGQRNIRDAFAVHEINNYEPQIAGIFETAKGLMDEESAIPQIAQGETGDAPDTLGGMSMVMNTHNVLLKRIVKQWDDGVTKPLITRFYDYNMQYSDKEEIKGDQEVDARGSSALMVKETQTQALMALMEFGKDPVYGPMTKHAELYRKLVEAQRISPDNVVYTDEELQEQQANQQEQGPDAEQQKLQMQYQMHQEELQDKAAEREHRVNEQELERELKILELTASTELTRDQIEADLSANMTKTQADKDVAEASIIAENLRFSEEQNLKLVTGSGI